MCKLKWQNKRTPWRRVGVSDTPPPGRLPVAPRPRSSENFQKRELATLRLLYEVPLLHMVLPDVGAGATVRQCLSIGEGAIVGAGAVVVKDVEPWTVVIGVPAHPLRRLAPDAPCTTLPPGKAPR